MRVLNKIVLSVVLMQLAGCAMLGSKSNLGPIPTIAEFNTFQARLQKSGAGEDPTPSQFKVGLIDFIKEFHGYAAEKRTMEWESSGITAYGGAISVLGAIAGQTGLMNTGAAFAGGGLVTSSRNTFGQQANIYVTAVKKLSCISSKTAFIPDAVFEDAKQTDDPQAAKIAIGAVKTLVIAVENIRIEAINSIMSLQPPSPTRDDYLNMFNMYRPSTSNNSAPSADTSIQRKRDAAEQIKALLAEVGVCTKS